MENRKQYYYGVNYHQYELNLNLPEEENYCWWIYFQNFIDILVITMNNDSFILQ